MRQKKLAQRAASAALAACMMFTLSAPALAESTNALMQMSINSRSSIARLNEENSIPEDAVTLDIRNGNIRVYIDTDGKQHAEQNGVKTLCEKLVVTSYGVQTGNALNIEDGCRVILNNAVMRSASSAVLTVSGNAGLTIEGTNALQGGPTHAGDACGY